MSLDPTPRQATASIGSGQGPAKPVSTSTQSKPSAQRTSCIKNKNVPKKPASRPKSVASGPSRAASVLMRMTPDNMPPNVRDADGDFQIDADATSSIQFQPQANKTGGIHQSRHAATPTPTVAPILFPGSQFMPSRQQDQAFECLRRRRHRRQQHSIVCRGRGPVRQRRMRRKRNRTMGFLCILRADTIGTH